MSVDTEEIRDSVASLLANLGETRDEIADALRGRGITGLTDNICGCPVANFLKENGVKNPKVDHYNVALEAYEEPDGLDGPLFVSVPHPVQAFIAAFDDGAYADLRTVPEASV